MAHRNNTEFTQNAFHTHTTHTLKETQKAATTTCHTQTTQRAHHTKQHTTSTRVTELHTPQPPATAKQVTKNGTQNPHQHRTHNAHTQHMCGHIAHSMFMKQTAIHSTHISHYAHCSYGQTHAHSLSKRTTH